LVSKVLDGGDQITHTHLTVPWRMLEVDWMRSRGISCTYNPYLAR